jgi:hypothetical protein
MVFFYEMLFVAVAVAALVIGEVWSRTGALVLLLVCWSLAAVGYASFGARLAQAEGLGEEERRWYRDARDGLRHLRLLFGLASGAALVWRLVGS